MNQIEKNTVDAREQLEESRYIKFINKDGKGKRIVFAGNSITLHGIKPEIGWHWEWGMAASEKEKDYVHILMSKISEKDADAAFCISQISRWEVNYKDCDEVLEKYKTVRDFNADIIIVRCIENCRPNEFEREPFEKGYNKLLDYLNSKNAKVIITTGFWRHPGDDIICKIGKERGYPVIELGDLGELDEMKAMGRFEHSGVANHPGDKGMEKIAERIWTEMEKQFADE